MPYGEVIGAGDRVGEPVARRLERCRSPTARDSGPSCLRAAGAWPSLLAAASAAAWPPASARSRALRAPRRLGGALAPRRALSRLGPGLGDPGRDPLLDRAARSWPAWRTPLVLGHVLGRRALGRLPLPEQRGHAGLLRGGPRLQRPGAASGSPPPPSGPPRPASPAPPAAPWPPRACAGSRSARRSRPAPCRTSWSTTASRVCRSCGDWLPTSRATGNRLDCCWYWSRTIWPASACWASSSFCPATTAALACAELGAGRLSFAAILASRARATASSRRVWASCACAASSLASVRVTATAAAFRACAGLAQLVLGLGDLLA